jgi:hypothetical protein
MSNTAGDDMTALEQTPAVNMSVYDLLRVAECSETQQQSVHNLEQSVHNLTGLQNEAAFCISIILPGLRQRQTDNYLHVHAFQVLFKLAYQHPANQVRIDAEGGILCIVEAMKHHSNDAELQHCGIGALAAFDSIAYLQDSIEAAGGIIAIVAAMTMQSHENYGDYVPLQVQHLPKQSHLSSSCSCRVPESATESNRIVLSNKFENCENFIIT